MPKTFTHVLSTSRKHTTGFLMKSFGECCGPVLTTACYWPSSHCIPAQTFVPASGKLNHDRSPLVLDSDKDACCYCFSLHSLHQRWSNYGPRATSDPFNQTRQISCIFFQVPRFRLSTASTAACHVNRTVSGPPVARQSRIRPSGQNVWPPLQGRNEIRWRPGQEASLAHQCSNLRSFGSKFTALKKVLATMLGLSAPTAVIRRSHSDLAPGELFPPCLPSLRRSTPDLHELDR